jgi:hypothetical protein
MALAGPTEACGRSGGPALEGFTRARCRSTAVSEGVSEGRHAVPSVLRRGMPYGPPLVGGEDDGVDRGFLGLFFCTDLRRQLYTMTGWIQRKDFSTVYNANRRVQDALSANRALSGAVPASSRPRKGLGREMCFGPIPADFVHTKGRSSCSIPDGPCSLAGGSAIGNLVRAWSASFESAQPPGTARTLR